MIEEYYFDYLDFFLHNCTDEEYKKLEEFDNFNFKLYFYEHKKENIIYHFCFENQ